MHDNMLGFESLKMTLRVKIQKQQMFELMSYGSEVAIVIKSPMEASRLNYKQAAFAMGFGLFCFC